MPQLKIRIETGADQSGTGNASATKTGNASLKKIAAGSIFAHQMMGTSKQLINFAVNNISNFTGNEMLQRNAQAAMEFVGTLTTIATGFISAGTVGGLVAVAGITTQAATNLFTSMRKDNLSERQRAYMVERSGNATKNGSRGTEN